MPSGGTPSAKDTMETYLDMLSIIYGQVTYDLGSNFMDRLGSTSQQIHSQILGQNSRNGLPPRKIWDWVSPKARQQELSGFGIWVTARIAVEYHATMESCSDKFHVDIPNVV
jgi:hypothetical protein